jgi:hypothetical protein
MASDLDRAMLAGHQSTPPGSSGRRFKSCQSDSDRPWRTLLEPCVLFREPGGGLNTGNVVSPDSLASAFEVSSIGPGLAKGGYVAGGPNRLARRRNRSRRSCSCRRTGAGCNNLWLRGRIGDIIGCCDCRSAGRKWLPPCARPRDVDVPGLPAEPPPCSGTNDQWLTIRSLHRIFSAHHISQQRTV